tara:strand:- start:576 stop:1193 length:618 start_codon:yes stop_codon:yes gene_type:complete
MLNKEGTCRLDMVWPFKKTQDDFNLSQMEEMRILPEYRSIFNMSRGKLKKDLKRYEQQILENVQRVKDLEMRISQLSIERDRLEKSKSRLQEREDAATNIELKDVNTDLANTMTEFLVVEAEKQRVKLSNIELDVTVNLLKGVISKRYKNVNDAYKRVYDYRETLEDFIAEKLAPSDTVLNQVPEKEKNDSAKSSGDTEPFDNEV